MVAVALDHGFEQTEVLGVDTRQTIFIDDQDALAVTDIEQGRSGWVVGSTIGIATDCLELTDAPCLKGIGDGTTHARMVLMEVDAFEFEGFAIEEETTVGSECHAAQSDGGFVTIHDGASLADERFYLI